MPCPALAQATRPVAGAAWLLLLIPRGPLALPGPKLTGVVRTAFRPAHWALYALIAVSVGLMAATFLGAPLLWAWNALLVLLVAGIFHAIFHLWRHTSLYDGALRNIMPRALFRYL